MNRETVLYFEDENGYGRVARVQDGHYDRENRTYNRTTDYLVIERYENGSWTETQELGDYTDPGDLDVPKP